MNEQGMVRGILLRIGRGVSASSSLASAALEWARPHAAWLFGPGSEPPAELDWDRLTAGIASAVATVELRPHALQLADELSGLLALDGFDDALLALMIACDRLPRVSALSAIAVRHGHDLPTLLGELAGAEPNDAERAVRRSPVLRLGLMGFVANRQGHIEVTSAGRSIAYSSARRPPDRT